MTNVPLSPFERIKQLDSDGTEYWLARDLLPILGYASWQRTHEIYQEIYTSLCVENPSQPHIQPSFRMVNIGSGAQRKVKDWRLSRIALDRMLCRVASHKPEAVRELRRQNEEQFRIEIDLGAVLLDFCEEIGLSFTSQKRVDKFYFDFCIEEKLLIEVDEIRHRIEPKVRKNDEIKSSIAAKHGYELLRIPIPVDNVARLLGKVTYLLNLSGYLNVTKVED